MKKSFLANEDIARMHNLNSYNATEYSFVTSYIWSDVDNVDLYEDDKHKVLVINSSRGGVSLIPLAYYKDYSSCIELALENININNIDKVNCVCEDTKDVFIKHLGDKFYIEEDRDAFDYIYEADSLRTLAGRKNSKKRNHLNYFLKEFEGRYEYKLLNEENFDECLELLKEWTLKKEENDEHDEGIDDEYIGIKKIFKDYELLKDKLKIAGVYVDNKLEAFTIGELINPNMALVHIEKANPNIRGLYQYINQQFILNEFPEVEFVNREEDLGIPGLRKAKLSYHPLRFVEKYTVREA